MTMEIKITCCGGSERYSGQCLRERCPAYNAAKSKVNTNWPRIATGFGNGWGEPRHPNYLDQVQQDVQTEAKKVE